MLGDDAFWVPPRLWAYAATNQPDGDFKEYSAEDIACGIGYSKDAQAMLEALLQAGFLDADMKIHDWSEHSGYHEFYANRARNAANARWKKEKNQEKEEEKTVSDTTRAKHSLKQCLPDAQAMLQASPPRREGATSRPRSVEEVIATGQSCGVSEQDCRDWYRDCEACGWLRGDGTPFDHWPRQLCIHRDKLRESRARFPQANGKTHVNGMDLERAIKNKEERAKDIFNRHASEGPLGTDWNHEGKKKEWMQLKREIKELKAHQERLVA